MSVDLIIEDDRWAEAGLQVLADRACAAALAHLGLPDDAEISLLGCDDARIATLNAEFRDKPVPTNVLSWPSDDLAAEEDGARPYAPEPDLPDMPLELGDIAIAYDTCAREATEQGKAFADHVTHLLVHGTLHLLGFDHIRPQDAALMERIEVEILASMGLADPYEEDGF
ncbi:rRNA maturation RNase YbeY [Actibacterium sp. XHP0104]|uniref:rRNA maturation RNase YbeY n=1 Tax=Actibacterium sp. XHP0104 TaxID=2984335 RepID=UPI0021E6DF97|nr:rRNA maturation RNase YbeY [Actibacterium sp. XHP0104]MCV2882191.1 rRNA maturation RNase YbeY [Actibacterium sp. XHP0104]